MWFLVSESAYSTVSFYFHSSKFKLCSFSRWYSVISHQTTYCSWAAIKCVINVSVSNFPDAIQIKPVQNTDSGGVASTRPSTTRRPTTIRVPSKTNSCKSNFLKAALSFTLLQFWQNNGYTMHSFPFGNIWSCCVMPKSLLSSQCQITLRTSPLLSRLKSQWETWADKFLPSRWDFPDYCMYVCLNTKTFFSNSEGLDTFWKWFSKYLNTCRLSGQGILSFSMQPEYHIGHWPYANQLLCDSLFFPHVSTNKETIVDP